MNWWYMKTKHIYNDDLESFLITMTADEFIEWLKTNEIEYKKSLLDTVKEMSEGIIFNEDDI